MKTYFLSFLFPLLSFGQVNFPSTPQSSQFTNYGSQNWTNPKKNVPNPMDMMYGTDYWQNIQRQNEQTSREVELHQKQRLEIQNQLRQDIGETDHISYNLPSLEKMQGAAFFKQAYEKMLSLNIESYSVKDVNFAVENAYYENKQDKAEFDRIIKNSGDFILAKMKELKCDTDDNVAKNYMLFQFFSENLRLKSSGLKHTPFKYDFNDYSGNKDWTNMFVSKLLKTKLGQCHSMPLLYLILAEQVGAEAYLSFSPNHSFIKFRDKDNKWYNIELTNGMFTTNSFLLNSGYIKAEALQNHIYLQNLSKQELLSEFFVDLASGYIHKFGYDDFVETIADKALDLYPNNVNAQMIKSNVSASRFEYVAQQLGIDPRNNRQLQKIRDYPRAVALLNKSNSESRKVEHSGFVQMPAEAYEKWLGSLKEAKQKQENETLNMQFKGSVIKQMKN